MVDGQDVQAEGRSQTALGEGQAVECRACGQAKDEEALGKVIGPTGFIVAFLRRRARGGLAAVVRQEPRAGEHHVDGADQADRKADRREVEEGEGLTRARGGQLFGDDHVGRGADEGQQAAEKGREGQGHQQARGCQGATLGQLDHRRHQQRRNPDVVHERRQEAGNGHERRQQGPFAASRQPVDLPPDPTGNSSARQSARQDEHGRDGDHRRIREGRKGLTRLDQPCQGHHEQHDQRGQVHRQALGDEGRQRGAEDQENEEDAEGHGRGRGESSRPGLSGQCPWTGLKREAGPATRWTVSSSAAPAVDPAQSLPP